MAEKWSKLKKNRANIEIFQKIHKNNTYKLLTNN